MCANEDNAVIRSARAKYGGRRLFTNRDSPGSISHFPYLITLRVTRYPLIMRTRLITLAGIAAALIALGCVSTSGAPITEVSGTWGGDDAGLIATDTSAHVHIGCTLGDTKGKIVPGTDGRFSIMGTYNVDAYPVDRGILHPAEFSGRITGITMTLTVVLTDTGRQLGPVTLILGKEPKMGPCPICRRPGERKRVVIPRS